MLGLLHQHAAGARARCRPVDASSPGCRRCRRTRPSCAATSTARWSRCRAGPTCRARRRCSRASSSSRASRRRRPRGDVPADQLSAHPGGGAGPGDRCCGSTTSCERFEPAAIERLLGHLKSALLAFAADPEPAAGGGRHPDAGGARAAPGRGGGPILSALPARALRGAGGADAGGCGGDLRGREPELPRAERAGEPAGAPSPAAGRRARSRWWALCVDRSLELVVGLLGILKAGGAYVPLDPEYPAGRLAYIVEDARVGVVVTTERPARSGARAWRRVCLGSIAGESSRRTREPGGRSGQPGLRDLHLGLDGQAQGRRWSRTATSCGCSRRRSAWFGFDARDVWTLFHSFAFDFSVWEIWGALLYGGRLVVVPYWVSRSPEAFHELLVRRGRHGAQPDAVGVPAARRRRTARAGAAALRCAT